MTDMSLVSPELQSMNIETLRNLQTRIRESKGADRDLDWLIDEFGRGELRSNLDNPPNYTTDPDGLGACVGLLNEVLPGWCWRIGTCCVSDDAWVAPDWNSPEHGARLREQYGEPVLGTVFDQGVDIDRRPAGNVCLAFLEAILGAKIAELEAQEKVG